MISVFLSNYLLFFIKGITFLVFLFIALIIIFSFKKSEKTKEPQLKLTSLNKHYEYLRNELTEFLNQENKEKNKKKKEQIRQKPQLFVIDFNGDVEASEVDLLREKINILLPIIKKDDEILLRLESSGGYVHSYGLAASQLARIKQNNVKLTVSVDKVAASGGYMMACVSDQIIAAPFAIIGSIGVFAAVPNFNKLLKKYDIDYEQHTAGQYKNTLSVLGENTDEGREKFKQDLEITHRLFQNHVQQFRSNIDITTVATGETWYGSQALEKGLVDKIETSDDYLLNKLNNYQITLIEMESPKEPLFSKLKIPFLSYLNSLIKQ